MKRIIFTIDRLNQWIFNVIAIIFGLISLLTIFQVFARYVLKNPIVWSEELIRYLMIWIVFLGSAIALRKGLLISVEIVQHLLSTKIRTAMKVITVLINIIFLVILIKYGFEIMNNLHGQTTGAMDIPVAWTYAAIPFGGILALVNSLVVLIELFSKGEEEKDGGNFVL